MILFLSPLPEEDSRDGYLERVANIDFAVSAVERVYVDFCNLPPEQEIVEVQTLRLNTRLFKVDKKRANYVPFLNQIFNAGVTAIYCHSIYRSYQIASVYKQALKVPTRILDIHGAVPEENLFLGKRIKFYWLSVVERVCFKLLFTHFVCVSHSMMSFYLEKYSKLIRTDQMVILPPVTLQENEIAPAELASKLASYSEGKIGSIYAGGTQKWQNFSQTLNVMRSADSTYKTILTPTPQSTIEKVFGSVGGINLSSASKLEVFKYLKKNHFSLVLRRPHILNYVSFPTKLIEALAAGCLPVLNDALIGDVKNLGIAWIPSSDFARSDFPTIDIFAEMLNQNFRVVEELKRQADLGLAYVQQILIHPIASKLKALQLCSIPNLKKKILIPNAWVLSILLHFSRLIVLPI